MIDFTLREIICNSIKDIDCHIKSHNIRDYSINRKIYNMTLDLYVFVCNCCEMGFIHNNDFNRYYMLLKHRLLKLDNEFRIIKEFSNYEKEK